ncbi:MAG: zinc-dependent peptidase [Crocinitomicaceae bacterium]
MSTEILLICGLIGAIVGAAIGYSKWSLSKNPDMRMPDRDFPREWRRILEQKIEFYNRLSRTKKSEFEKRVHIFLLNVQITGIDTEVTHEDRILVASGAIIPIFGFDNWHYSNLKEVEIYPDKFLIPKTDKMASGLVGWGAMEGKMMLSRKALHHGFYDQNDQKNVAIHEFIHILDKQDGEMDGVLEKVMNEVDIMPWLHIINMKMKEIDSGSSSIREYGAANKAEFLAVVSEFFFESPEKMKSEHPALYSALNSFYNPQAAAKPIQSRFKKRRRSKW